jgi:hypothetical protein
VCVCVCVCTRVLSENTVLYVHVHVHVCWRICTVCEDVYADDGYAWRVHVFLHVRVCAWLWVRESERVNVIVFWGTF